MTLPTHSRILSLIQSELHEVQGEPPERVAYDTGWIERAAMEHYATAIAEVQPLFERMADSKSGVEDLCAEIGFWRALVDLKRAQLGQRLGERRRLSS